MRAFLVISLTALTAPSYAAAAELIATLKPAATKTAAYNQAAAPSPSPQERRCAYLGRWGSFHIIGSKGTAAYRFRSGAEHVAELVIDQPDPNWWVYRQLPSDTADPGIKMWAFARQPYCGTYRVAMFRNGAWRQYEDTYAWGKGLGAGVAGAVSSDGAIFDLERDVRVLKDDVRTLKGKVQVLEGGR